MDIAIIGGGAATVGLLDALAATTGGTPAGGTGTITVFEPSPRLWRGRAYGPDMDSVLVNAPPAIMSIRSGDFGHYATWLGERGADHTDPLLGRPLVPRALYGDYLVHSAEKAVAALGEQGWRVRVVAGRVTEVVRSASRLVLRTHDVHDAHDAHDDARRGAHEHDATHVVLCVGGGTPPDLYGLSGRPGFTVDPYPLADTLGRVPTRGDVAVIGSGLTAVDVVVSLAARGHTGGIALLSRSGVLPHVWQRPIARSPQHATVERVARLHEERGTVALDDLIGLLRAELDDAGEDFDALATELLSTEADDPVERLRRQLAAVADPRIGRRVLQETMHTVGPYAWRLLAEPDRARLRRHLRTAVSVASPMIPGNASVLMRLLESGQLTLVPGVRAIEPARGRFRIRHDGGDRNAEFVVNAVNPPPQAVPEAARDLVRSLAAAGLAALHPSGGLTPSDPRVHVVGDLSGGGPALTASIPALAAQGAHTVRALLQDGNSGPGRR
ncbi:FAD/NAD(P)-binding protein [Streptomyces sp. NPDC048604]|uniref:FAD/NAD(P)-binding protein n=1 Tax=Streptomyces sp. NPDC048604 TaxID=3365578 RepID=UPI003721A12F